VEVIREGKWICPNCNVKNKGSHVKCEGCGQARENVQFIYEEDGAEVTDAAEKSAALEGPDWVCGFCNTSNPANLTSCKQCSAGASDGQKRAVRELSVNQSAAAVPQHPTSANVGSPTGQGPRKPAGPMPVFMKVGCAAFVFGFMLLIGLAMYTSQATMSAKSGRWERAVVIEEYKTVRNNCWRDQLPSGARLVSQAQKQRTTRKVQTGTKMVSEEYEVQVQAGTKKVKTGVTDLGNGRFKEKWEDQPVYKTEKRTRNVEKPVYREDPVYDTWATYDIDQWTKVDEKKASGSDGNPRWPETGLKPATGVPSIGQQREALRTEKYSVVFADAKTGKEYPLEKFKGKELTSAEFESYMKPGSQWDIAVTGLGGIDSIKPAGALAKP